jgi:flagellar motor switch protein FliN/FliY
VNDENITAGAIAEHPVEEPALEASAPGSPVSPAVTADADAGRIAMRPLETLSNVELAVTVELGRTRLLMKDLLSLRPGSVVELDRHVGAPVDIFVNSTLLAHGEVVVVDDELGVRITAIDSGADDSPGG